MTNLPAPVDRLIDERSTVPPPTPHVPPSKRKPPIKQKLLPSAPLDSKSSELLEKRVETHRHKACTLADRLAEEIRLTLDSGLPKKEKARLVRELTWSYGVLFDKAAGGESSATVKIQLPADVLSALKIGIALQVAPKASIEPQAIVVSPDTAHHTVDMPDSLRSCETSAKLETPIDLAS